MQTKTSTLPNSPKKSTSLSTPFDSPPSNVRLMTNRPYSPNQPLFKTPCVPLTLPLSRPWQTRRPRRLRCRTSCCSRRVRSRAPRVSSTSRRSRSRRSKRRKGRRSRRLRSRTRWSCSRSSRSSRDRGRLMRLRGYWLRRGGRSRGRRMRLGIERIRLSCLRRSWRKHRET